MSPASQQTATIARLVITNGTAIDTVSLLVRVNGAGLQEWTPKAPAPSNPIWASSPYQDGKHLVNKTYDNIVDTFIIAIEDEDQDDTIYNLMRFTKLLERAINYWTDDYNTDKFWLEVRGTFESNIRYALVVDYGIPEITNPLANPFGQEGESALGGITLVIEHTIWADTLEVGENCTKISSGEEVEVYNRVNVIPTAANEDDCYTLDPATFTGNNVFNEIGRNAGALSYESGVRFRTVAVPKDATITRAWVTLKSQNNNANDTCNVKIYGELNATPLTFSTYADLKGRTRTATSITWSAIPHWIFDDFYDTPDIKGIIQEIVNLAGWASGNALVLFFPDNASSNNAVRVFYSVEGAGEKATLHIEWKDHSDVMWYGEYDTCDRRPVVQSLWRPNLLTHAFSYDASLGTYSTNMVDDAPAGVIDLLPALAIVANNDCFYAIMDELGGSFPASCPFNSLALDLNVTGANITVAFEYETAGGWVALPGVTYLPGNIWSPAAGQTGMNIVVWDYPVDWIHSTINGIHGYAVRWRVTAVGGGQIVPQRDPTKPIYTISWPHIKVLGSEIMGDLPAFIDFLLCQTSVTTDKLIIAAKKISRTNGETFTPYVPLYDALVPAPGTSYVPGVTNISNGGGDASSAPSSESPVGGWTRYTPAGAGSGYISTIGLNMKSYAGRFRVFCRAQVQANAGQVGLKLIISTMFGTYSTQIVYNRTGGTVDEVFDLGLVSFPPEPTLEDTVYQSSYTVQLHATHSAAVNVYVYDLVFIPVDEAHIEINYDPAHATCAYDRPEKVITSNQKMGPYGFLLYQNTGDLSSVDWGLPIQYQLKPLLLGQFDLEPEEEYMIIFLNYDTAYGNDDSQLVSATMPLLNKVQRYLLSRGAE